MRLAAVLLAASLSAAGCSGDPHEEYCAAVADRQAALSETVAGGGPDALLAAYPTFEALAEDAPDDIRDEWTILLDRLGALRDALDAAGVDPATYDAEEPPPGVDPAGLDRIEKAARDLGSEQTQRALADLGQQALDVCGTPLVL